MVNAGFMIAAGVVIAVAAVFAVFADQFSKPQRASYGGERSRPRYRPPTPPSSPPPSRTARKRRSPKRRSNSPSSGSVSVNEQHETCTNCGESPYIKVNPCGHQSWCKGCFTTRLETNDMCPDCNGRIDSCSPPIPSFGKCRNCQKFTKLFKFLRCNHSLSLCISCFEEQDVKYKACPECNQKIRGSEPSYLTSGLCGVCEEFTRFAVFQPCGHGNFCRSHAHQYLDISGRECSECGGYITAVE